MIVVQDQDGNDTEFSTESFIHWVWEIFLEGYKSNVEFPSKAEAVAIASKHGYRIT
jgi:hypothetical protein